MCIPKRTDMILELFRFYILFFEYHYNILMYVVQPYINLTSPDHECRFG